MSSPEPIGGFLELESLPSDGATPELDGLLLNSGRACIEYLVTVARPRRVLLPDYVCEAVVAPLERLGIDYGLYQVDGALEIGDSVEVGDDEFLLYVDYFGVKSGYARSLAQRYGARLVVDGSQSFFYRREGTETSFTSPRKFFGVPDGGVLTLAPDLTATGPVPELEVDESADRFAHLLGRLESGPESAYAAFVANEERFDSLPMRAMSNVTAALLRSIPLDAVRRRRNRNFGRVHDRLGTRNALPIDADAVDGPNFYPFMTDDRGLRERLRERRIFSPTLWPDFPSPHLGTDVHSPLADLIVPLPIDQRYGDADMDRMIEVVHAG